MTKGKRAKEGTGQARPAVPASSVASRSLAAWLACLVAVGAIGVAIWVKRGGAVESPPAQAAEQNGQSSEAEASASEAYTPPVVVPNPGPAVLWVSASDNLERTAQKRSVRCLRRKSDRAANSCMPKDGCSRHVIDGLASPDEVTALRGLLEWLVAEAWGAGSGPPSVVDLHQGTISYKDKFVMLEKLMEFKKIAFTEDHIKVYNAVRDRVGEHVKTLFGAPSILPEMTFFSHINASKTPMTMHDEYWHPHIDTQQYGTFAVTTILYLNGHGSDFEGGKFRFADDKIAMNQALGGPEGGNWSAVQPIAGRIVAFTSGQENVHHVEPVTKGVRLGLTMAFTCNGQKAASVPHWDGRSGSASQEETEEK